MPLEQKTILSQELEGTKVSICPTKSNKAVTCLLFDGLSIFLSGGVAFFLVKPVVFDWTNGLGLEIILSLVTGSILSMWFSELITEEGLGNGSSMLIFINIVGSIPNSFNDLNNALFSKVSYFDNLKTIGQGLIFYFFVVSVIILFQDSFKKILNKNNLKLEKLDGMNFNLIKDEWSVSSDTSINYIVKSVKL